MVSSKLMFVFEKKRKKKRNLLSNARNFELIEKYFICYCCLLQDIADSAYKFRKGQPQLFVSFSVIIADTLFSLLVQTLFLIQSMVVNLLPFNYFGIICNVHLCLLYSLYSFEYKWCNMGWELHKRLTYIETHWPYFLGFGTILTILTQLTSSVFIRYDKLRFFSLCVSYVFGQIYVLISPFTSSERNNAY